MTNDKIIAMYAFSGDPITEGHIDVVKRAARNCDELIVGIGTNPAKQPIFELEERLDMARHCLGQLDNVRVVDFNGLLTQYAREQNVNYIVKGVRNSEDVGYEQLLDQVGKKINEDFEEEGIDTYLLFARPELAHISSSVVKAIQLEHGPIHKLVPLYVKQKLEAKMFDSHFVGVTGEVAVGKSYFSDTVVELGKEMGITVSNLDMDILGHQVLATLKEPFYKSIREKVAKEFSVGYKDDIIDRKALGEIVFDSLDAMQVLNEIMHKPIMTRYYQEIRNKCGMTLVNAARIAEAGINYTCNNNIVLLSPNKKVQHQKMKERGLNREQIKRRLESQYCTAKKEEIINQKIKEDNCGKLWKLENSNTASREDIKRLLENVVEYMGIRK